MIVKGTYTSVWDGGICLESDASIDTEDRTFEIDDTSYDVNVDVLEDEYVTLPVDKDGNIVKKSNLWKEFPACHVDEAEGEDGNRLEGYEDYFVYE